MYLYITYNTYIIYNKYYTLDIIYILDTCSLSFGGDKFITIENNPYIALFWII